MKIPQSVIDHVTRHYGDSVGAVLAERDLRFTNPLLKVSIEHNRICFDRLDDFFERPWSTSCPEPGSLTEFLKAREGKT